MEMSFRWFGSNSDKITLEEIRQIPGVKGVVGSLFDIPVGEIWPKNSIEKLKKEIEAVGLSLKVIESVNIHEDIKLGLPSRDKYIRNYCETIRNLSEYGIEVICYNFMPVFDWMKTDLNFKLSDDSYTMAFISDELDKDPQQIIDEVEKSSGQYTLPGWEPERLSKIKELLNAYKGVDENQLRDNLSYFLKAIIPVCEEVGIKMAIHPDDPPYSIFNLPRIVKNRDDLDWICNVVDSPNNGITLCTGSIAEDPRNNVYAILEEFCKREKIFFAHVRNIQFIDNKDFYESAHYSECGSLDMVKILNTMYSNGFNGYIRPDHGRMIWGEKGRPGYGLYDRAIGASYLLGIWETLEKLS